MPDTINAGDPYTTGVYAWRWSTTEPRVKKPVTLTVCTVVTTRPDATTTTTLIGSLRNPEGGRYELDGTSTVAGTYQFDWTCSGTFTDEDSNLRTYTAKRHTELVVAP